HHPRGSGALRADRRAVLGDDADTTGAIFGQIAGVHYGVESIPAEWRQRLTMSAEIASLADGLKLPRGIGCPSQGSNNQLSPQPSPSQRVSVYRTWTQKTKLAEERTDQGSAIRAKSHGG
ncbi:MAG: hypothetical protein F4118_00935, partial [Acidimicrobiaceae bacterium]|nr:hypothetical protein [Acidimicrobiaceae bacterium]